MAHTRATFVDAPDGFITARQKWRAAMLLLSLALTSAITLWMVLDGRL